jgi:hypothetical protein
VLPATFAFAVTSSGESGILSLTKKSKGTSFKKKEEKEREREGSVAFACVGEDGEKEEGGGKEEEEEEVVDVFTPEQQSINSDPSTCFCE